MTKKILQCNQDYTFYTCYIGNTFSVGALISRHRIIVVPVGLLESRVRKDKVSSKNLYDLFVQISRDFRCSQNDLFLYVLHIHVVILHIYMHLYTTIYTSYCILLSSDNLRKGLVKSMKSNERVTKSLAMQTTSNCAIRSLIPEPNT